MRRLVFVFLAVILALGWLVVAVLPQPAMADGPTVTDVKCYLSSRQLAIWQNQLKGVMPTEQR